MRDLIINTPTMQSLWQRYSSVFFTFIFWVVWFFLWIPVATAFAWYLGIDLVYFEMFEMDGYKAVIDDLFRFLVVVAVLGGSLAIWAAYNYFRFRGKDRRSEQKTITPKEIAESFEIKDSTLKKYQHAKLVSVSFDDTGKITGINDPDRK